MKILYLKLLYFSGIYNGSGLTKFELDLTKSENRILMFNGGNGSGKSTVQSTLHPFSDTLDGRVPIMKGKKGEKQIVIQNTDGKVYDIHHYWNPTKTSFTVKSYISIIHEDGTKEDLNPNGNVTSFKELVKEIFDVEESYFKLIRIGSDVTNFIDLGPSQRKKFISNFLPDIEPYLKAYKVVTEQWTTLKKNVATVSADIQKLDTKEHLEDLMKQLESQIDGLNKDIEKAIKLDGKVSGQISTLNPNNDISIVLASKVKEQKALAKQLESINTNKTLDQLKIDLNSFTKALDNFEGSLEHHQDVYTETKEDIQKLTNEKTEKEIKLSKYTSSESLSDCKKMMKEYQLEIDDSLEQISEFGDKQDYNFDTTTLLSMQRFYQEALAGITKVKANHERTILDLVMKSSTRVTEGGLNLYKQEVDLKRRERDKIKFDLSCLEERREYSKILSQRPSQCKIDSCPFIKDALKNSGLDDKIKSLQIKLNEAEAEYKKSKTTLDKIEKTVLCKRDLKSLYDSIGLKEELSKIKELSHFATLDLFIEGLDKNNDPTLLEDFIELSQLRDRIKDIKENKIPNLEKKMEILSDKEDLVKSLKHSIKELDEDIYNLMVRAKKEKDLVEELKDDIEETKGNLERTKTQLELQENYTVLEEQHIAITNEINEYQKTLEDINELNEKLKRVKKFHKSKVAELQPKSKDLDKVKYKLNKLIELEAKKVELEQEFGKVNVLRDALSPTKGIPVILTNAYLKPIKRIANELLDEAFDGKFYITDFVITDKDFFIQVRKEDGQLVNDVCDASQGEKALVTIAISLALLERSGSRYNIPLFDEIDATLDKSNRQAFLDILNKQLDKLGVVQASVISHNNSFDTAPVDLVLFKGSTVDKSNKLFMSNKKILLDIN